MRTISIITFLLLNWTNLTSQDYNVKWDVSLGTPDHDHVNDVISTQDDHFLFATEVDDDFGNADYHIIKTNQRGEVLWERTYGGDGSDALSAVIETPDGGFLLGGYSSSFTSTNPFSGHLDYWLVKVDSKGAYEWEKSYGGPLYDIMRTMVANDQGYLLVGTKSIDNDEPIYRNDAWVVQIDHSGNLLWEKRYGGSLEDSFHSALVMDDGNFLFNGITKSSDGMISNNYGYSDIWVVCTDPNGELLWEKTYGGSSSESIWYDSMKQSLDGNYLLYGYTGSSDHDLAEFTNDENGWVFKINKQGEILWSYAYGHEFGESISDVKELGENRMLLFGDRNTTEGFVTLSDYWILIIDQEDGKVKNEQMFGGSSSERGFKILENKEEDIILTGTTRSSDGDITNPLGLNDIWALCIDLSTTSISQNNNDQSFNIYPNPTTKLVYLDLPDNLEVSTNVFDVNGKLVLESINQSEVDLESLPSGMYFFKLHNVNTGERWAKRVVKE